MLIDELKQLHGLTSYSVLKKNSNMFQYNDKDWKKLKELTNIIQLLEYSSITKQKEDFIETLFNINKVAYMTYPKYRNV